MCCAACSRRRGATRHRSQIIHDWYGGGKRRGRYDGAGWQEFARHMGSATPLARADDPGSIARTRSGCRSNWWKAWEPIAARRLGAALKLDEIREFGARLRGRTG